MGSRISLSDNRTEITTRKDDTEIESSTQYYTSMASERYECVDDGDYASVLANPRYSDGLGFRENKLISDDSQPQNDFKPTEDNEKISVDGEFQESNNLDEEGVDGESQERSILDEEGIYEEPDSLAEYIQIVHGGDECMQIKQ